MSDSDPRREHAGELSITDFMTDGSLASLCAELGELLGVPVELRDRVGRPIVRGPAAQPSAQQAAQSHAQSQAQSTRHAAGSASASDPPALAEHGDAARAWSIAPSPAPVRPGEIVVPIHVQSEIIGAIVVAAGEPALAFDARPRLEHSLSLLASAAADLCEHELELRHAFKETSALFKMSSLLARNESVDRVLEVALDLALSVLGLDAGSIVLLRADDEGNVAVSGENESDLELRASRNLSREWLEDPKPLGRGRIFDRLALGLDGRSPELVAIEDLQADERVQVKPEARREGVRAFLNCGLMFRGRPIGLIRLYSRQPRVFNDSDKRLLRSVAAQAAVAVEQARLLSLQEQEKRTQRQLQLAAEVQGRMIPRGLPATIAAKVTDRLDIAACCNPSSDLGGDFYDYLDLRGHLGIVVGDVVGKGVPAALLMSATRASLRAYAQEVYDLDEIIRRVNVAIASDTLDREFVSLWYGVIDAQTLRLTYCSAGHEPTLILRRDASGAEIRELSVGGTVVGIDASQTYEKAIFDLHAGDVLVAYTDGVTDTMDFNKRKFGRERLRRALLTITGAEPDASAERILQHIQWELRQFAGLAPRTDDETIVVVRVR